MPSSEGFDGGAVVVGSDDRAGRVGGDGCGPAENLARCLGRGDALVGVLADHVPGTPARRLGLRPSSQFRGRRRPGQRRTADGLDAQEQAAADQHWAQREDVGHRAEQPGGIGDADRVVDSGRVQQGRESLPTQGQDVGGSRGILEDGASGGQQRGQGMALAGVGLLFSVECGAAVRSEVCAANPPRVSLGKRPRS